MSNTLTSSRVLSEFAFQNVRVNDPWLSQDKFLHFSVSAGLVGIGYYACTDRTQMDLAECRVWAASSAAIIALGKEILDKRQKDYFSWKDLAWDGIGILVGLYCFCR